MDKSAKVEAALAIVAPAKVAKKGKRDAEVAMEKNVSSKKQKRDVEAEQAALKKNVEAKTQKNVFSNTRKKPIKKQAFSSSDDDSSESDDEPKAKKVAASVGSAVSTQKKDESTNDSAESSDDDPAAAAKQNTKSAKDDSDEESDDEYPKKASTKVSKKDRECDEDERSEEEEGTDEEDAKPAKTPKKFGGDVEMVDAEAGGKCTKKASQTPAIPRAEGASKTLLVRLPYEVDRDHLVELFKDVGEAVDVHVNVEFGTEEAAQKAVELIKERELSGGAVRLDWRRERGAFTPRIGEGQSIYVRGFDKSGVEDEIRRSLQEHFGSCGEITRCEIPRKFYTGKIEGYAIIDFIDRGAWTKALELDMSELGGYTLCVRKAYPRRWGWGGWIGYGKPCLRIQCSSKSREEDNI